MTPNLNNPARDQIARDVQAFLDRGGKIKVLPYGPDVLKALAEAPETVFTKHAARMAAARARGLAGMGWRQQEEAKFNNNDTSPAKQRERAQARKNKFKAAGKAVAA